jgi:putative addiction module killer protein
MTKVQKTDIFLKWLNSLKDSVAVGQIARRLDRLALGHFGDVKTLGDGVSELRVHVGQGYRLYFTMIGDELVVLLCGGDKRRQTADIERAKSMARELRDAR